MDYTRPAPTGQAPSRLDFPWPLRIFDQGVVEQAEDDKALAAFILAQRAARRGDRAQLDELCDRLSDMGVLVIFGDEWIGGGQ